MRTPVLEFYSIKKVRCLIMLYINANTLDAYTEAEVSLLLSG